MDKTQFIRETKTDDQINLLKQKLLLEELEEHKRQKRIWRKELQKINKQKRLYRP